MSDKAAVYTVELGSSDSMVRISEVSNGYRVKYVLSIGEPVQNAYMSGNQVVVQTKNRKLKIYDPNTGHLIRMQNV